MSKLKNSKDEVENRLNKIRSGEIKHSSFILDTGVKAAFKAEVSLNGGDMSSIVNSFMENYIDVSRRRRENKG